MIEDKLGDHPESATVGFLEECLEVGQRSKVRVHIAVLGNIKAIVLELVMQLAEQGKLILYQNPLHLSDEFNPEGIVLETVTKEIARLQATGQLDIKTELHIAFTGDKRVLSDLELLANSGYGEDHLGNNIALPKELAYLHR